MKKETAQAILKLSQEEYDEYASEFSNSRQFFWDELKFLKEYANKGDRVLDIGCGNGRLSDMFIDNDINYTGVDFSKSLIDIAKEERGENGRFIQADALKLPLKDNSFNTIFSIAVLHHIPSKGNRVRFVSEAYRVLNPGGVCVLTVWNTLNCKFTKIHVLNSLKKILFLSKLDFGDIIIPFGKNKRKRYIHSFTKKGLKKLFEKNGFSNISIQKIKRKSGHSNLVVIAQKDP
ncbi:MAG: class I SAM-dependent methyltransferase [Patescibacteria group bacterium]